MAQQILRKNVLEFLNHFAEALHIHQIKQRYIHVNNLFLLMLLKRKDKKDVFLFDPDTVSTMRDSFGPQAILRSEKINACDASKVVKRSKRVSQVAY